jgi:hypothetical protein
VQRRTQPKRTTQQTRTVYCNTRRSCSNMCAALLHRCAQAAAHCASSCFATQLPHRQGQNPPNNKPVLWAHNYAHLQPMRSHVTCYVIMPKHTCGSTTGSTRGQYGSSITYAGWKRPPSAHVDGPLGRQPYTKLPTSCATPAATSCVRSVGLGVPAC